MYNGRRNAGYGLQGDDYPICDTNAVGEAKINISFVAVQDVHTTAKSS